MVHFVIIYVRNNRDSPLQLTHASARNWLQNFYERATFRRNFLSAATFAAKHSASGVTASCEAYTALPPSLPSFLFLRFLPRFTRFSRNNELCPLRSAPPLPRVFFNLRTIAPLPSFLFSSFATKLLSNVPIHEPWRSSSFHTSAPREFSSG